MRKPYRPDEIFDCMARHLGVRYRRAHTIPERRRDGAPALLADTIAQLPAPLRIKLRNAVVSLDARLISEVIREIAEQDAVLGLHPGSIYG